MQVHRPDQPSVRKKRQQSSANPSDQQNSKEANDGNADQLTRSIAEDPAVSDSSEGTAGDSPDYEETYIGECPAEVGK